MPRLPRQPGGPYCWPPPPPPWSLMVRLNGWDADWPLLSVTFMVKSNLPAWVGVPASWLLLSFGAAVDTSARPGGSCPEATDLV